MSNLLKIDGSEKNRILSLHESKKNNAITEQDAGYVGGYALAGAGVGAGAGAGVFSVPGAIIGGLVGAIYGLLSTSPSVVGAKKIMQFCSSKGQVGKPTQSRQELNNIADGIFDAVDGLGTDEDGIKNNLKLIKTFPDLCAMASMYRTRHGESLMDAIDGDIDSPDEWKKYVYLPLLDIYETSKELAAAAAQNAAKTTQQQAGKKPVTARGTTTSNRTNVSAPKVKVTQPDASQLKSILDSLNA